ncbi:MAG: hypothetical protein NTW66_02035 [Candidatus Magasanikbacteria bacterium]|nr:hypothetical protein [Candidatus Magasanikbacteria bacterium]
MAPIIIPAILVSSFNEFKKRVTLLSPYFSLMQIDVMDGEFVRSKSFEEIEKINELANLPDFELHLMVTHPLEEIGKWEKIKNIKKIIFHVESSDDPAVVAGAISGRCSQTGIAINPETPLAAIEPYLDRINEVLFLTVHPGEQGAKFLPEVGKKISELSLRPNRPLIGVDGGINENNIAEVKSWGAEIFCIGSALTKADDIGAVYNNLSKKIK